MPITNITNGVIEDIFRERGTTFVTVAYTERLGNRRREDRIRLVVGSQTVILNENGFPVPVSMLRVGMTINATVSSAMTRSIPPQANAFLIRIVNRQQPERITVGNIVEIDRRNRSFTLMKGRDYSDVIRFNVPENVLIFDRMGRPINFSRLSVGMRVRVRHANFMTASIPPQTTAFEIQVL